MAQSIAGIVPGAASDVHDEPHIEGSRITVLFVQQRVEQLGLTPQTVAERHDLDLADVYAALSYYPANPDEMRLVERRRADATERANAMSTLSPPDS